MFFTRIPEFTKLWKDILHHPQSLSPQFTGKYAYDYFRTFFVSVVLSPKNGEWYASLSLLFTGEYMNTTPIILYYL